ncbi:hypothetical protein HCN44_002777 [Aphidius gifuensis]|uniref:Mitochondrial import inner membrane translocase subunit Tim23 n=2 Tax=Aphidius gifuensis TaxID=684658 RepID=A0A834XPV8_APHGI|nr:mitochondrial import inner membrane translocase subunit Tim23 isoform X2 [Aphidius gifuensis]KAF7991215.1 hypothetical protein HCN44_002777 [Aphidius gifuensis]
MDFWNNNTNGTNTSSINNDDLNIPVTSQHGTRSLSPYLNFDPSYLQENAPEFITLEDNKQRGRFEHAFVHIGGASMIGASIGGTLGFYRGLKATTLAGQTGKLRRTQLINHFMKNGSTVATKLGAVTMLYNGFGVLLEYFRETEDPLNALGAATVTGMFYKSSGGLRKCVMGGGVGLALASIWCLWNNREALSEIRHHRMNPA